MERTPWWSKLDRSALREWDGVARGVKADGGGNIRGQGRLGRMEMWRAVHNRDAERARVDSGLRWALLARDEAAEI
jgi:hypothetical protein